ncbi:hypothetical protein [Caballeronia sp. BR00000012568055]|uniref:hypothetical protein n=1 Tax=Caballeronia sp. BR00000012568055 TaxID=2918761 RepID=UPI0023FA36D6|nr:hypothetical protein [Caballeronia sp. BR00000012568055]
MIQEHAAEPALATKSQPHATSGSDQAASSIEYREARHGFLIHVSPNKDGSFSVFVEGGRASEAASLENCLAAAGRSGAQKFQTFDAAIEGVEAAKGAIDEFVASRDA